MQQDSQDGVPITDRIVASYLQKRGFRDTEELLRQEAGIDDDQEINVEDESIANFVLFYNEDEVNNPKAYDLSYSRLVKWADESIDIYKFELRRILYPVWVHAYIDLIAKGSKDHALSFFETYKHEHMEEHSQEIERLSGITDPIHVQENELVRSFRTNKFGVKMCKYSFELLLCFLQDNKFMLILRLMNQYIKIEATADKPGQLNDETVSGAGLIGTDSSLSVFNQKEVKLGRLPKDLDFYGDIKRAIDVQIYSDSQLLLEEIKKQIDDNQDSDSPAVDLVPLPPKSKC